MRRSTLRLARLEEVGPPMGADTRGQTPFWGGSPRPGSGPGCWPSGQKSARSDAVTEAVKRGASGLCDWCGAAARPGHVHILAAVPIAQS
jgi:hypothetical protein